MNFDEFVAEHEARSPTPPEIRAEVDPPNFLALNVINLRSARGLTQAELAAAIGVSQPRIAEIERGDSNPRLITLSRLALALGVALSELLVDRLNADEEERLAAARERIAARGTLEFPRKRQAK